MGESVALKLVIEIGVRVNMENGERWMMPMDRSDDRKGDRVIAAQ
jgi:hypothetical protein